MGELRVPIRELLTEPFDERDLRRIGARIAQRRALPRGAVGVLLRLSLSPAICGSFAAGALTAVLFLAAMKWIPLRGDPASAELRLRGGGSLVTLAAPVSTQSVLVQFSEGSEVVLRDQARIDPIENNASRIVLRQTQGQAVYDVKPGGARHWLIESPPVTVEVLGTRFMIERTDVRVRVALERGHVVVRAPQVRGGEVRLESGQSIDVPSTQVGEGESGVVPPRSPADERGNAQVMPTGSASPWQSLSPTMSNRDSAPVVEDRRETPSSASVSPTASERTPVRPDAEELFRQADLARRQGRGGEAAQYLERILAEYGRDSRVGLAAFYLGKIQLDSGRAGQAVGSFELAIARGLPAGLLEDAFARRVEARVKAGDKAGAISAAKDYIQRFPNGHYREAVERWAR